MAPPSHPPAVAAAASDQKNSTVPANTAATKSNAARRAQVNKPVIPAIPLPYVQRRSKPPPAATTVPGITPAPASALAPAPTQSDTSDRPVNKDTTTSQSTTETLPKVKHDSTPTVDRAGDISVEERASDLDVTRDTTSDRPEVEAHGSTVAQPGDSEVTFREQNPIARSSGPFRPSAASPAHYQMPPPFQPASATATVAHGPAPNPGLEPVRLPPTPYGQSRSHIHQHHPSNGSLVFGGFYGSNASSPAPNSGGMFPPPSAMQYRPEQLHMAAVDEYGRPMMANTPLDGYPPGANHFGQTTPHGSQGSMPTEENGYLPPAFVNGHSDHDPKRYNGPSGPPSARYPQGSAADMDNREDIFAAVQGAFANPEFADCELSLQLTDSPYSDDMPSPSYRDPFTIPAHRLILARSPTLRNIMHTHGLHHGKLSVSSDDPFIRSDAFWFAIQCLYGYPLHELPPEPTNPDHNIEIFNLALGYAASGSFLQIFPIVAQGVRDAGRLISWSTLEKGVDFAMAGATILYPTNQEPPHHQQFLVPQYRDGPIVHELMMSIITFLIDNFPPTFVLHTEAADSRHPRIPMTPTKAAARSGPTIAHSTSSSAGSMSQLRLSQSFTHDSQNARASSNPRLSSIQFGDISPAKGSTDQSTSASPVPDEWTAVLSRVLINLPFDFLKLVLESHDLGNISGWMKARDRYRVMSSVVAEREARRLLAVDAVQKGRLRNAQEIQSRLAMREPPAAGDIWNALGWKEEVSSDGIILPKITRTWVPLALE